MQPSPSTRQPACSHGPQYRHRRWQQARNGKRTGIRIVSNGKLLRQLIRFGADGDLGAFRGVAKQVIADERQKQHHLLADDLESILYGRTQSPASPALRNLIATIPEDRERGIPLLCGPRAGSGDLEDVVAVPGEPVSRQGDSSASTIATRC